MKESVYHEMVQQLKGEKMRVTELSKKINELHGLEEEQRHRARSLADERDRWVHLYPAPNLAPPCQPFAFITSPSRCCGVC
jgi:hypothetical protein